MRRIIRNRQYLIIYVVITTKNQFVFSVFPLCPGSPSQEFVGMSVLINLPHHIEDGKKLTAKCIKVNTDGKLLFQDVASKKMYTLHPDVVRAHLAKNKQVSDNEADGGSRRLTRTEKEKRNVLACLKDIAARRAKIRADEREEEEADQE